MCAQGGPAMKSGSETKWSIARSSLTVTEVSRDVMLLKMSGFHEDAKLVQDFSSWFDAHTDASQQVHMFWDTEETTGYKTHCREALQQWERQAAPRIASSIVLVRSKLMEMALSIANLVNGSRHKATTDRRKFEAMLAQAMRASAGPRRA
jgi:hypothetical protein